MQSEGIEVSAEMEFLNQQNIMLDLENKALKQRLESIAQEQVIKRGKYMISYFIEFSIRFLLDRKNMELLLNIDGVQFQKGCL